MDFAEALLVFLTINLGFGYAVGDARQQDYTFPNKGLTPNSHNARVGEAPFVVSLQMNEEHFCLGSLIMSPTTGKQFILTSAWCASYLGYVEYDVIAGAILLNESFTGQRARVERILMYPDSDPGWTKNNIAILHIPDFELNEHVQPISLPVTRNAYFGNISTFGWGYKEGNNNKLWNHLQVAEIPTIDLEVCKQRIHELTDVDYIFDSHICAGIMKQRYICHTHYGGPLTYFSGFENMHTLLGIGLWGDGCGNLDRPGLFTRVSSFVPWILVTMEEYSEYSTSAAPHEMKLV